MKMLRVVLLFPCLMGLILLNTSYSWGVENSKIKEPIPSWIFPKPFKYDAKNLPDPFIPFIKSSFEKETVNKKKIKGPLTPLQKISPSQLKLVGIIISSKKGVPPMALVELPNKKAYILKIGTSVGQNGGTVSFINYNSVIITEPIITPFGEKKNKKIVLKLHTREGE